MELNWWCFEFQRRQQLWNLFCRLLKGKATGTAGFEVRNYFCSKPPTPPKKAICTDGEAAMTGQFTSLVPRLKSISYF
jgi:hypothetical protein